MIEAEKSLSLSGAAKTTILVLLIASGAAPILTNIFGSQDSRLVKITDAASYELKSVHASSILRKVSKRLASDDWTEYAILEVAASSDSNWRVLVIGRKSTGQFSRPFIVDSDGDKVTVRPSTSLKESKW